MTYEFAADWSRGGTYDRTLEDLTPYVLAETDIVAGWGRGEARATEDPSTGSLSFGLTNIDRQFSPENTASPIAGRVLPGTPVRLQVSDPLDASLVAVFQGPIDTLDVDPNAAAKDFTASCADGWGKPADTKLSTTVYQGLRTGELIGVVLDAIGWPADKRSLDWGATQVPYWWLEDVDAASAINDLVHSEGPPAATWVQNGVFYFRDRHHRVTQPSSLTSQGIHTHTIPAGTGPGATVSLLPGTFETAGEAANWAPTSATFVQSSAQARSGAFSGLLTVTGTPVQAFVRPSSAFSAPVRPGVQYRLLCSVRSPSALSSVSPAIDWFDAGLNYITTSNPGGAALAANTWVDYDYTSASVAPVGTIAPPGAAWAAYGPTVGGSPAAGTQLFADNVSLLVAGNSNHKILAGSFQYQHGLDRIINSATLEVAPWQPDVPQVVWSITDPIALNANETTTLVISSDTPFIDLQVPTQSFTYLDDGIFRSDYSLASGSISSITLSRTSGQSALLTITAGVGGAFLDQGINVRGRPLKQGAARQFTAVDPASQATYGNADWGGSAPWAHLYDAQAIVNRVVSIYSQPQPSVTFDIEGALSAQTLSRILHTQISDRITVRNDELGLNADFFVEKITHTIRRLGARHVLTVGAQVVQPYQAALPFMFDVSGQGFDQGQFSLDAANNPATMFRFDVSGQGFSQGVFAS